MCYLTVVLNVKADFLEHSWLDGTQFGQKDQIFVSFLKEGEKNKH